MNRRPVLVAAAGVVLVAALTSCSVLRGGHEPLPTPSRSTAATTAPDGSTGDGSAASVSTVSLDPPPVAAGTVVAATDVTSPSGETSVHVEVVSNDRRSFDVRLSGYRTTNPQDMTLDFSDVVPKTGDGYVDRIWGQVQWSATAGPPDSYTVGDAGTRPDFLRSVFLVPTLIADGDGTTIAPWAGHVLAVAPLTWNVPNPYPDLAVTVGAARPGAYGLVQETDGHPTRYEIAHGDDQVTVAKRFGITVPELRWMNPTMGSPNGEWLLEGSMLNLDPAKR